MIPFVVVSAGQSHPQLADLQRRLRCNDINGVLDEETSARLRGLQSVHGLPATGVVDTDTARFLEW